MQPGSAVVSEKQLLGERQEGIPKDDTSFHTSRCHIPETLNLGTAVRTRFILWYIRPRNCTSCLKSRSSALENPIGFHLIKKFPAILWNSKVNFHVHKSSRQIPILSHIFPARILVSYFFKAHFNVFFPSMPRFSKWSPSFRLFRPHAFLFFLMFVTCPAHLCKSLQSPVTSVLLSSSMFLSALSKILGLRPSV